MDESTLKDILKMIEGEFNSFKAIELKYKLIRPIEEISQLETEDCRISGKYKNILFNREDITYQFESIPKDIKAYEHIVESLCLSYLSLKSIRSTDKLRAVQAIIRKVSDTFNDKFDALHFYKLIVE